MSPAWSPADLGGPSPPGFNLTKGDLGNDQNVSGDLPTLGGGSLPDDNLALLHGIELILGDHTDNEFNPGDYGEVWLFSGHGNADPHFLGNWDNKLVDSEFVAHMRWGYLGIEDTASGTGGSSAVVNSGAGQDHYMWSPPAPLVSATGEFSVNWEGDGDETGANKGEFALRAYWTTQQVTDEEFLKQLLRDR